MHPLSPGDSASPDAAAPSGAAQKVPGEAANDVDPAAWRPQVPGPGGTFWVGRAAFLRLLGLVYAVAFGSALRDGPALFGTDGLLPADRWMARVAEQVEHPMTVAPSLFWATGFTDGALVAVSAAGLVGSLALLAGRANAVLLAGLWGLYFSIVSVGQRWYSFGWESQLLETGLLACFLVPVLAGPWARRPSRAGVLLGWWLVVRIMLGAGLIKLRGDPCWTELTCLHHHFETQPIPGWFSRAMHRLPGVVLSGGVLFNHAVELVAPWLLLGPRRVRHAAAAAMVAFQAVLIVSVNLAFLNWLTVVPMLLCFDDEAWGRLLPGLRRRAERAEAAAPARRPLGTWVYAAVVAALSVPVVANLVSPRQSMNRSFDALRIVNTYGAFGSVGVTRPEIALEGTQDPVVGPDTAWHPYEFRCKPGALDRRPCQVTPWHQRLDWLAWFAGLEAERGRGLQREAWVAHLAWKLLEGDEGTLGLMAEPPFEGPATYVRATLHQYRFAEPGDGWWVRDAGQPLLPPLRRGDPDLAAFLVGRGWMDPPAPDGTSR